MSALTELDEASRTVVAVAAGGTVAIGRDGRGTGIVIAEGRVLTNAHNLRDRTTQVTFADGRVAQAEVTGSDVDGDLTVLAVDTTGATPLQWAEAEVDQGDWVFALASGGLRGVRVTSGSVSALLVSALSRATTAAGVPAGATTPYHWSASKPATPAMPLSATVGTSGNAAMRCVLLTASGRRRPLRTCGSTAGAPVKVASTWPAIRSLTDGAVPR